MSEFTNNDLSNTRIVYTLGDEVLEEVDIPEGDFYDEDDDSIAYDDNVEENDNEDTMVEDEDADAQTGSVDMSLISFTAHTDCVYCIALNHGSEGQIITGGGDDVGYIWRYDPLAESSETASIQSYLMLSGHTDTVTNVGFNFDGTLAFTGSYDGTIRIYNVGSGEMIQVLEGPEDVEWASWHPKGNAIVAGSKDGTVWLWLAHEGRCLQVFAGHEGGVTCGGITSDGKVVYSGGEDGTVRIWAPKTGQCKHTFDGHDGHEGPITCMANCVNDPSLLLSGSMDGKVKLLHIGNKRVLFTFVHSTPKMISSDPNESKMDEEEEPNDYEETSNVECIGFSNGEFRWAASGGLDKTMKIWDLVSGSCRSLCQHQSSVVSLKWHARLPVVATAALDCIIRLWDARAGAPLLELTGHNNIVTSIEYAPLKLNAETEESSAMLSTPATDVILSVSDDKTAKVFHVNTYALLR